jgi:hypothetical protein
VRGIGDLKAVFGIAVVFPVGRILRSGEKERTGEENDKKSNCYLSTHGARVARKSLTKSFTGAVLFRT